MTKSVWEYRSHFLARNKKIIEPANSHFPFSAVRSAALLIWACCPPCKNCFITAMTSEVPVLLLPAGPATHISKSESESQWMCRNGPLWEHLRDLYRNYGIPFTLPVIGLRYT